MTYTHLTTNELVMIEAYYQENTKISRYCDFTWQIKTDNLQCHQLSGKKGTLPMITMSGIKSIRNDVVGIKQGLHNQKKKFYLISFRNKIRALMSLKELIQIGFLVL